MLRLTIPNFVELRPPLQSTTGKGFFSVSIKQHSHSSSFPSRFHIRCLLNSSAQAIDEFMSLNQTKGEQQLIEGEWQMIWSSQVYNNLQQSKSIETNGILTGLDLRTLGVQKRLERDLWCAKGFRKGPLVL